MPAGRLFLRFLLHIWYSYAFPDSVVYLFVLRISAKSDEGRVFPFTKELRAVLEAQYAEHLRLKQEGQIVPWVFFRLVAQGRGGTTHPKRIRRFNKAWKVACAAAGAPGRIPHDLRRTAVRNLVRAGVPERVAMEMTGHKTRSVFERYNIVSECDLVAAAKKLNAIQPVQLPTDFDPHGPATNEAAQRRSRAQFGHSDPPIDVPPICEPLI